ncbi:hypothetical protein DFR70_107214 [Nocardia tenerifensis]|uniref:Uncharacterized protein n=1 Tax=Nocardia tenerifensis TaxID=228006 RepID=A0A318JZ77_9NOCA|nr:hypothetical protein [Nocardia tenerifensis]PXX62346.1 hypothetical protein DFR70_107214 [Nocardia tenerifensis]
MRDGRALPLGRLAAGVAVVALVVFIVLLGVLHPPRKAGVFTDRLGPEQGEQVADYLARARDSLAGADTADHWALVSFTEPVVPEQIPPNSGGLRIAQVLYRVPVPRVQTPLVAVPVPAGDAAAVASAESAAWLLPRAALDDRAAEVGALSAARLRSGCACAVGIVVRGPLDGLRKIASQNGIRAVEALPADAVAGRFGVVPLLPDQLDIVAPGPNDGPVPDK